MSDAVPAPPVSKDSAPQPPAPFRCTRAAQPFDPLYLKAEAEKMNAYADLGQLSEARECAEKYLADWEVEYVRSHAMSWAMRQQDFQAAEAHANVILNYPHDLHSSTLESLPVVLHYAGRNEEAYTWAKLSTEQPDKNRKCGFLYSLACYALPVKKQEESLQAILECFARGNTYGWEPWRKAFMDSELAPLWEYVRTREFTIEDAIKWADYPLEEVLNENLLNKAPRVLDYEDLRLLPSEFEVLLERWHHNTAVVDQAAADTNPELFEKYLQREQEICAPRIDAFEYFVREVRNVYDLHVPDMVRYCIEQKQPSVGRLILQTYLRRHPKTNPHTFPNFPELKYWFDEWNSLWEVSSEGLQLLIDRSPGDDTELFLSESFACLPARLRESGLGWLVQGAELLHIHKEEEAIASLKKAEQAWPGYDATAIMLLTYLVQNGRWEEAEEFLNHPAIKAWPVGGRDLCQYFVASKSERTIAMLLNQKAGFPTPEIRKLLGLKNSEFLAWVQQSQETGENLQSDEAL